MRRSMDQILPVSSRGKQTLFAMTPKWDNDHIGQWRPEAVLFINFRVRMRELDRPEICFLHHLKYWLISKTVVIKIRTYIYGRLLLSLVAIIQPLYKTEDCWQHRKASREMILTTIGAMCTVGKKHVPCTGARIVVTYKYFQYMGRVVAN